MNPLLAKAAKNVQRRIDDLIAYDLPRAEELPKDEKSLARAADFMADEIFYHTEDASNTIRVVEP